MTIEYLNESQYNDSGIHIVIDVVIDIHICFVFNFNSIIICYYYRV